MAHALICTHAPVGDGLTWIPAPRLRRDRPRGSDPWLGGPESPRPRRRQALAVRPSSSPSPRPGRGKPQRGSTHGLDSLSSRRKCNTLYKRCCNGHTIQTADGGGRAGLVPLEVEDLDALEDVFATVQVLIGVLNLNYAGNNIRNLRHVREVLAAWNAVRTSSQPAEGKQGSELRLLGFADGPNLTALGRAAAAVGSEEEVARIWCAWLQRTDDTELLRINHRLVLAKRVFAQFWRLRPEVREYFLANAERPADRRTLQTIELLCEFSARLRSLHKKRYYWRPPTRFRITIVRESAECDHLLLGWYGGKDPRSHPDRICAVVLAVQHQHRYSDTARGPNVVPSIR